MDPTAIPPTMTREQLEYWILFSICVAGKSAKQTEKKMKGYLGKRKLSPFDVVRADIEYDTLRLGLTTYRMGQYARIEKAFREVVKLDTTKLTLTDLEAVPGIGPKTARMILLYSQPDVELVPLDTHVLKYLALMGVPGVPKSTPAAGPRYERLEKLFIEEAKRQGKTIRQLDTDVWLAYSSGNLASLPVPTNLLIEGAKAA